MNIVQQVARRRCAATGSPARPAPHPQHAAGGNSNLSSGSSTRHIVAPGLPGCLPGRRHPRQRRGHRRRPAPPRAADSDGHAVPRTSRSARGTSRDEPARPA